MYAYARTVVNEAKMSQSQPQMETARRMRHAFDSDRHLNNPPPLAPFEWGGWGTSSSVVGCISRNQRPITAGRRPTSSVLGGPGGVGKEEKEAGGGNSNPIVPTTARMTTTTAGQ